MKKLSLQTLFLAFFYLVTTAQNTVGLITIQPDLAVEGYNLIYPEEQSSVYLLNNCGEVVNSWNDPTQGRPATVARLLENGNLLRSKTNASLTGTTFGTGGAGGIIELLDWNGEVLWSYTLADSLRRQHHEVFPMPNGNILLIAWEKKSLEEILETGFDTLTHTQREIWSDFILEINPGNDSIVWEWHAWDHLVQDFDPTKNNYGNIAEHPELIDPNYHEWSYDRQDWLHSNGLDYNAEKDQVMLCVRNFNEIWIIDHSTTIEEAAGSTGGNSGKGGTLLYRWGNPKAYKSGETSDRQLFWQHDAQWIDDFVDPGYEHYGKIVLFNNMVANGISYGQILEPVWDTSGHTYLIQDGLFLPEDFTATLSHPDTSFNHSTTASSIQVIGPGHIIMCAARQGFSFELTGQGDVVWEYRTPLRNGFPVSQGTQLSLSDNFTFQLKRYPADYTGLAGKDLSPKGFLELDPNPSFCSLVSVSEQFGHDWINIYPNPVTDQLTIETEKEALHLLLCDLYGRCLMEKELVAGKHRVDVSHIPAGIYFLQDKKGYFWKKIVIQ